MLTQTPHSTASLYDYAFSIRTSSASLIHTPHPCTMPSIASHAVVTLLTPRPTNHHHHHHPASQAKSRLFPEVDLAQTPPNSRQAPYLNAVAVAASMVGETASSQFHSNSTTSTVMLSALMRSSHSYRAASSTRLQAMWGSGDSTTMSHTCTQPQRAAPSPLNTQHGERAASG